MWIVLGSWMCVDKLVDGWLDKEYIGETVGGWSMFSQPLAHHS
jgi:hypothetical protein